VRYLTSAAGSLTITTTGTVATGTSGASNEYTFLDWTTSGTLVVA
jgi:hypothetical protein